MEIDFHGKTNDDQGSVCSTKVTGEQEQEPAEYSMLKKLMKDRHPQTTIHIFEDQLPEFDLSKKNITKPYTMIIVDDQIVMDKFQLWTEFQIVENRNNFLIKQYVMHNGQRLHIVDEQAKLMAIKLQSKLNQLMQPNNLVIHPITGSVNFSLNVFVYPRLIEMIKNSQMELQEFFQIIECSFLSFKQNSRLILYLLHFVQLSELKKIPALSKLSSNFIRAEYVLKFLGESLKKMHIVSPTEQQPLLREKIADKMSFISEEMDHIFEEYHANKVPQQTHEIRSGDKNNYVVEVKKDLRKNQDQLLKEQQFNQEARKYILSRICFLKKAEKIHWKKMGEGGFGVVEFTKTSFTISRINDDETSSTFAETEISQVYTQEIIRKSDKSSADKIMHEKDVLCMMKDKYHPNVATFFASEEPQCDQYLYALFQKNLSLDTYLRRTSKTSSLLNKMNLMYQALSGLVFLQEHGITHLDLKPGNMLVSKSLILKICDFGQAYVQDNNPTNHEHAYTIPYSPAQMFHTEPRLNEKVDVYEMGVTIYKCLFKQHMWGYIRSKAEFIKTLREEEKVDVYLMPQKCESGCCQELIKILNYVCLRCIDESQERRPSLLWVCTILKYCHQYLSLIFI